MDSSAIRRSCALTLAMSEKDGHLELKKIRIDMNFCLQQSSSSAKVIDLKSGALIHNSSADAYVISSCANLNIVVYNMD